MNYKTLVFLFSFVFLLTSCATTARDKIFQSMIVAGTTGIIYGLTKDRNRNMNAAMYGGVSAAVAGATTLYLNDPDKENQKLREEIKLLTGNMDKFEQGKLTNQGPATFGAKVPEKYKAMINPGEWRIYETDSWHEDGENRLIHQDRVMELIPPSLIPVRR